jgi:hypothetical protein
LWLSIPMASTSSMSSFAIVYMPPRNHFNSCLLVYFLRQ